MSSMRSWRPAAANWDAEDDLQLPVSAGGRLRPVQPVPLPDVPFDCGVPDGARAQLPDRQQPDPLAAAAGPYYTPQLSPARLRYMLALPFLKDVLIPLGLVGYVVFGVLVIVGTSNAVNLTDGLDGLAIGPVIMASAVFGLIAYVVGNTVLTNYLYLHHIPRSGELAVLLSALVGAGLGFLWFNAPPAMVFMGDTGSL